MAVRYAADTFLATAKEGTQAEYTRLKGLCFGTTKEEEGQEIIRLIESGAHRLLYGPNTQNVLHVAIIHGNKNQLETYQNSLLDVQWQILCSTKDSRGMTPVDVAKHIVENIKAKNWDEIKGNYYRDQNEDFWQDFDFDVWVEYCEWFLAHTE
jgi:hypothetical protein